MKRIIPSILLFASLFLYACNREHNGAIKAQGIIDGTIITMKSQVTGSVDLRVKSGQKVPSGEILASVDSRKTVTQLEALELEKNDLNLTRDSLKTSIRLIERQLEYFKKQDQRFARLVEAESLPREKKENMELQRLQAETQLFDQRQKLSQLDITEQKLAVRETQLELLLADHELQAPREGCIIDTYAESGEILFPGSPVLDLLVKEELTVDIFIEEKELSKIAVGSKADIIVDGRSAPFPAVVRTVGREAEFSSKYIISERERESLLYKVTLAVAPDPALKIGQPVSVEIIPES